MKKLPNIHPGEILEEEFLKPLGISPYKLAKEIGVPQTRISEILQHKRSISVDTALRLEAYFDVSAQFWLNLQIDYDLEEEERRNAKQFAIIKKHNSAFAKQKSAR